ncbi:MAG TPA: MFS transporter [Candidatus Aquilonibacter sp.]|nr:MFS transporter [Candidatus Aquilonibacter sp.]
MPKTEFYGWKLLWILWAFIFLNFAFPTFGMSVVNTDMARAMHLNHKELGLAYSAFSLMAGLPAPLVAMSINRFGIRLTVAAGALLVATGALLMIFVAHTALQSILILALLVGFGASMGGTLAPQVAMARWFYRKRALAIATVLSASGTGGCIAVPFLNQVIARFGGDWRAAWVCMGSMSVVAAIVALIFVKESPEQLGQVPDGIAAGGAVAVQLDARPAHVFKTTEDWTLGEALRSPSLWMLVAGYLGFFAGFFIYVAHGIANLEGLGHSPAAAARSLALLLFSALLGQFTVAALGDRIEMRFLFAVAVCFFGAGIWLAARAVGPASLYPYAILMGSGFGASFTCMMALLGNYYGAKAYPLVLGVTMPFGTIVGAIGPVVAGYFYDKYGSYTQVFSGVAAICFATGVLLIFAKPPVRHASRDKIAAAAHAAQ